MYMKDAAYARRIYDKQFLEKQKSLMLIGERFLLSTICFDINIEHPYGVLTEACTKFGNCWEGVMKTACNLVNCWLRTTLCLQYKPHYIAAGSLFLAAKRHGVKLPSANGYVWWHEFEVAPRQLHEVIREMNEFLNFNKNKVSQNQHKPVQAYMPAQKDHARTNGKAGSGDPQKIVQIHSRADEEDDSSSSESCILSTSGSYPNSLCLISDLPKADQHGTSENPKPGCVRKTQPDKASIEHPGRPDLRCGDRDTNVQYFSRDCATSCTGNDMNNNKSNNNKSNNNTYTNKDTGRIRNLEEDRHTISTKMRMISNINSKGSEQQNNWLLMPELRVVGSVTDLGSIPHKRRRRV